MKTNIKRSILAGATALICTNALGAEYWLCAGSFNKTMPDNSVVQMWGYADVSNVTAFPAHACPASGNAAYTSPGPRLTVPLGNPNLIIHLQNTLGEATSLVIPGQTETAMAPVIIGNRVHSFTHEAPAGGTDNYTWGTTAKPLRPGSYIYETGTHPAKQVQMGLFGAVTKNNSATNAYPGGPAFSHNTEVVEFLSEIDPALHSRVASGAYGAACENPANPCTGTLDYNPSWFLVNGNAFVDPSPALPATIPAGNTAGTTLIRFFNMGLRSHNMILQGGSMKVIAEDGRVLPAPHDQYSIMMAAGKTHDVLFRPSAAGIYPLYERMHNLASRDRTVNVKTGGLMSFLNVSAGTGNTSPSLNAIPTPQSAIVGTAFSLTAVGVDADVGDAITYSMSGNPTWLSINSTTGIMSGTPDVAGSSTVTVTATDLSGATANQIFTLNVTSAVATPIIYFSTAGNVNPTGLTTGIADNADIYSWNGIAFSRPVNTARNVISETGFIANPLPSSASVDELKYVDASQFYLSFANDVTLPGLGLVQDEDIVYYNNGVWSVFFDGTAAGLSSATAATELNLDVDAFTVIGSTVYFSTFGNSNPPGVTGIADNADIYSWNGTAFARVVNMSGAAEAGVITNPVPGAANVDGLKFVDPSHFYLSFTTDVVLPNTGGTLAVQDEDIVYYNNGVWSVFFDGTPGLGTATAQQIDGFDIIPLP